MRKISKELAELIKTPPEGIKLIPNEEDVSDIQAIVEGPGKIFSQNFDGFDINFVFVFLL